MKFLEFSKGVSDTILPFVLLILLILIIKIPSLKPGPSPVVLDTPSRELLATSLEDYHEKRGNGVTQKAAMEAFILNTSAMLKLPDNNELPVPRASPQTGDSRSGQSCGLESIAYLFFQGNRRFDHSVRPERNRDVSRQQAKGFRHTN